MKLEATLVLLALLGAIAPAVGAQPGISPPDSSVLPAPLAFRATDRPGDGGNAVLLTWTDPPGLPADAVFEVRRARPPADAWTTLAQVPAGTGRYVDATAKDDSVYRYQLLVRGVETPDTLGIAGAAGPAVTSDPVSPGDDWFRSGRTVSLLATVLFVAIVLASIQSAKSGREIFIRRIAGLNAVDEAIGRATEIGKKVMYIPGSQSMDDIQTVASVAILGHVARATARYGTDLDVPNKDPLTFASSRESVRAAYLAEGRPDLYREEMVNYVTYDQFAYTAAVSARMTRERPAAIFMIGHFFAESLILAETGQSTGAIQIAGQADPTQLPFFVATCDYTLIGEELYAASAYLSREPVLLGSMRGQDIAKGILILIGLLGVVLASVGVTGFAQLFQTQ